MNIGDAVAVGVLTGTVERIMIDKHGTFCEVKHKHGNKYVLTWSKGCECRTVPAEYHSTGQSDDTTESLHTGEDTITDGQS